MLIHLKDVKIVLPIYQAISFKKVLTGGRTKPWLILAQDESGIVKPMVMKMFDTINLDARDHVTAEVVGHVLAEQFDLNTPKAAFIETNENFLATITDTNAYATFEQKDQRLKFATELLDGNYLFDSSLKKSDAAKIIDLETLFAFDNFIRNRDRNNNKPNLLVKSNEGFLIDHEMGLELDNETIVNFRSNQWDARFMRYHICFEYLRHSTNNNKRNFFDTFEEYLRRLNLNILGTYFKQLRNLGYDDSRHDLILSYFNEIKKNSNKFVILLKAGIDA